MNKNHLTQFEFMVYNLLPEFGTLYTKSNMLLLLPCMKVPASKQLPYRTVLLNLSRLACSSSLRSCSCLEFSTHCSLAWGTPFCIAAEEVPTCVDWCSPLV